MIDGSKTVTRRRWKKCLLKPGDLAQAYDKSPRAGGKKIGVIKILNISRESLGSITDEEVKKEGYPETTKEDFIDWWMTNYPDSSLKERIWRIEFKKED